jgi:hypothetical protein
MRKSDTSFWMFETVLGTKRTQHTATPSL